MMISAQSLYKVARLSLAAAIAGAVSPATAQAQPNGTVFETFAPEDAGALQGVTPIGGNRDAIFGQFDAPIISGNPGANVRITSLDVVIASQNAFSAIFTLFNPNAAGNMNTGLPVQQVQANFLPIGTFPNTSFTRHRASNLNLQFAQNKSFFFTFQPVAGRLDIPLFEGGAFNINGLGNFLPNGEFQIMDSFQGFGGPFVSGSFAVQAAAVPEPATWAMLIFGFAAVGTSLRRRPRAHSMTHRLCA